MFIVALATLHVVEGFLWVRREALAFAGTWRGFVQRRIGGPLGTPREVLLPVSPLPPLFATYTGEPWPLTPAADGVWLVATQTLSEPIAPPSNVSKWTWAEAARVRRDGRAIEGPGGRSVKASSPHLAAHIVEVLRTAAAQSTKERARYLDRAVDEAYDIAAARDRLASTRAATWRLRVYGNLLLPILFAGAYGLFFVPGVLEHWPWLAVGIVGLMVLIWVETWSAHRRLYPALRGDRWMTLLLMVASPPAAVRAHAWLAKDALARFHPLAVGAVLLSKEALHTFMGVTWRDLESPLGPVDETVAVALAEGRARHRAATQRIATQIDLDVEALTQPPNPDDASVEGFCPRCHEVYRLSEGPCSDCPGVALRRLPTAA